MEKLDYLSRHLMHDEYTIAAALHAQCIAAGHDPVRTAAIVYRQGRLDGREESNAKHREKERLSYEHRQRVREAKAAAEATTSLPEATTEGSTTNE